MLCTLTLTGKLGMGGYTAGVVVSTVLELGLCLWAAVRYTGLTVAPRAWLLTPALAGSLSGLNGRLLLRVLKDARLPELWCVAGVLVLCVPLYLLTVRLLRKRG